MSSSKDQAKKPKAFSTPSLLEPESRGGDTAEGGFSFQDGVILSAIPLWLAHEGFASFIRESIGDIESRWFNPASGETIDTIEAKNHHITPAPFWDEVGRFQKMASSPQHRRFTLACTSVSDEVKAIGEAMRRIRDPATFYGDASTVVANSVDDFVKFVEEKGQTRSDAEFLLNHVDIQHGWTSAKSFAEGMFRQAAEKWLPGFSDLPGHKVGRVFARLLSLVRERLNQPIARREVEAAICAALDNKDFFANHRIRIETTTSTFAGSKTAIRFDWDQFFGGNGREYPALQVWQRDLVGQVTATRQWLAENRSQRRIVLGGERRLSTSIALGSLLPAVSGFSIDLEYRVGTWSTDSHPKPDDSYELTRTDCGDPGSGLVIMIDVLRDIADSVAAACPELGLDGLPRTHFHGAHPIKSDRELNLMTRLIKQAIEGRLRETGASTIHLFLACPSPLALFLGHRLNATAAVQCYEWIGESRYVPTCRLCT